MATGGGRLVYLEVVRRPDGVVEVVEISNVVLDSEVACVDVSPLGSVSQAGARGLRFCRVKGFTAAG